MMATFQITSVNPQTRQYDTKFGPMVSYQVMLNGPDGPTPQPVEVSQKATTPAPQVGASLEGMIDMSGQYGPKFKKEYGGGFGGNSGGFTQTAPSAYGQNASPKMNSESTSGKFNNDPFTMYLSYAKDIVVALVEAGEYTDEEFERLLTATVKGGKALYGHRPGAELEVALKAPEAVKDAGSQIDMSEVNAMFGDQDEVINTGGAPWDKPKS